MEPKTQPVKIPEAELEAKTDLGIQYHCQQIVPTEHLRACVEKANLPKDRGGFFREKYKEALSVGLSEENLGGTVQFQITAHNLRETLKAQLKEELGPKAVKD